MMWFRRSDSRLTMLTRCFSSSSSGTNRANSFTATDIAVNGCRKPAHRCHPFLRGHFLFQPAQFGQVLKIEHVSTSWRLPCPQWRNGNAHKSPLPARSLYLNLPPQREFVGNRRHVRQPEIRTHFPQVASSYFSK